MSDELTPSGITQPTPSARQDHPPEPQMFTREYVTELREENKAWRQKHGAADETASRAKAEAEAAKAEAEAVKAAAEVEIAAAQAAAEQKANERVIRAELKAEAIKAGMVDIDGLKLADLSTVKLDEQGNVTGAAELFAALKEAKPYLFQAAPAHSSQPAPPPPPKPGDKKSAKDMTAEEFAAARRAVASGKLP